VELADALIAASAVAHARSCGQETASIIRWTRSFSSIGSRITPDKSASVPEP
jgi:hypothetical protein